MGPSHNPHTIFSSLKEDFDQRPLMLKDFLRDDRSDSCSSSSSPIGSDQWHPYRKSNAPSSVQLSSRSKSAAMHTISAFHKVVNLVKIKIIPFASRGKGRKDIPRDFPEAKVKVKDILRWTSFRDLDLDMNKSTPLDHLTSITMDSASRSSTSSSSSGRKISSWSQIDLTADDFPFWYSENKVCSNNRDDMLRKIPKEEWAFEESDLQSPVSVLHDSLFLENEGPVSPCHTSLRHSERVMGEVEEKAKRLLSQVLKGADGEPRDDHLMLDFFEYELSTFGKSDDLEFNGKILEVAKSWKNGECKELLEWELEDGRDAFVRDMEREVVWNKFGCEVEEMCEALQIEVWSGLLCEILNDIYAR